MMIYNPKKKFITDNNKFEEFYCGEELDEVAIILSRLHFGTLDLQGSYDSLVRHIKKEHLTNVISQMEDHLHSMLERGIIENKPVFHEECEVCKLSGCGSCNYTGLKLGEKK